MKRQVEIVVEKHSDGYVAHALGMKGAVVGQGDTLEEVLKDIRSTIEFHLETFGVDAFDDDSPDRPKDEPPP